MKNFFPKVSLDFGANFVADPPLAPHLIGLPVVKYTSNAMSHDSQSEIRASSAPANFRG